MDWQLALEVPIWKISLNLLDFRASEHLTNFRHNILSFISVVRGTHKQQKSAILE